MLQWKTGDTTISQLIEMTAARVVYVLALALLLTVFFSSTSRAEVYEIPLFLRADDISLQSFVRIQGAYPQLMSNQRIQILGYDDAGQVYGPIWLEVDNYAPVTFNSDDLERGNISKGLWLGLGDGSGDWRLLLTADDQHLDVRAYVRNVNGAVTPIHHIATPYDTVPGHSLIPEHFVSMLNPAWNTFQTSFVRVSNRENRYVRVQLRLSGGIGGYAWCDLPPYSALIRTSAELVLERFSDTAWWYRFVG